MQFILVLDAYELREGHFELVDTSMVEERSRKQLFLRLVRFLIVLMIVTSITFIVLSIVTSNPFWLAGLLITSGVGWYGFRYNMELSEQLLPQISGLILDYDADRNLQRLRVRRWMSRQLDSFTEEDVRHNQAIGFKVIWQEEGLFELEIIVDTEFPGTKIFETFDFLTVAELRAYFQKTSPEMDTWLLELYDGAPWTEEMIKEFEEEVKSARVPWNVNQFFTQLHS